MDNLIFLERDLDREGISDYTICKVFLGHSLYLFQDPERTLAYLSSLLPLGGEIFMCNPSRKLEWRELWSGGISFLREVRREKGFASIFFFLLIAFTMGILNVLIQHRKKKKVFHCWDREAICELVTKNRLRVKWIQESCLGRSHLLLCAVKE